MTQHLNQDQQAAVDSDAPRRLVIASPGSGKTKTLVAAVEREAKEHGAAGCVVISYTNSACDELRERLAALGVSGLGACSTLHAFLFRCLQEHNGGTLSVIDNSQREALVEEVMEDLGVKVATKHVLKAIEHPVYNSNPTTVELVALEYHQRLARNNLVDFQQILYRGHAAAEALKHFGRRPYKALFVDEVQDAAYPDWCVYGSKLFERKFLVGDPDQSIFQFRGANPTMLVKLAEHASNPKSVDPKYELHLLNANYRSGVQICNAANWLIRHNKNRVDKDMVSASKIPNEVAVHRCETPAEEMSYVLERIEQGPGDDWLNWTQGCAILCRTNHESKAFAQHLAANGVPVATVEQPQRPPDWREAKLLLTVLANPFNDTAVLQLVRATESPEDAKRLREAAALRMCSVNEVLGYKYGHCYKDTTMSPEARCIVHAVEKALVSYGSQLAMYLSQYGISAESRQMVHNHARELSKRGQWSINDLIVYLNEQDSAARITGEGVKITTIHAAKGTEADVVFLCGMEEGILPSAKDCTNPEALEESRRLAFTAITRAKSVLTITWCSNRPQFRGDNIPPGPMESRQPSRFIVEMGLKPQ